MSKFASFWNGPISPYEIACLLSFAERGHDIVLYVYKEYSELPISITQCDASSIIDKSYIDRFITNRSPNIAQFSDYFRYKLFEKTESIWVDTDVFVTGDMHIDRYDNFFVKEGNGICNAILRISSNSPVLGQVISLTESLLDRDVPWAAVQNTAAKLIRRERSFARCLFDPDAYIPLRHDEFYKYLLPEFYEECAKLCSNANSIHIYNNILAKIGYYKCLLPPKGSYLHEIFKENSCCDKFIGAYPAEVVRSMADGWRMRFSGECIGLGAVVRQAIPACRRTMKRKFA